MRRRVGGDATGFKKHSIQPVAMNPQVQKLLAQVIQTQMIQTQVIPVQAIQMQAIKGQSIQIRKRSPLLGAGLLRKSVMACLAGLVVTTFSLLQPLPAMALAYQQMINSTVVATMPTVAAMPGKAKAVAKDTEGKLESAYGGLTGDVGRQIKGNAKQAQSSAMSAGEDLKEGAKSVAKKVGDAIQ